MKVTVTIKQELDAKTLYVEAGVRYWEDATVNGVEDTEGELIPCRVGEYWMPIIDIDKGQILNWTEGTTADIHYKVCDDGTYTVRSASGEVILKREGYVPKIMCPQEEGFGDYIIMKVDKDGMIANWKPTFRGFEEEV